MRRAKLFISLLLSGTLILGCGNPSPSRVIEKATDTLHVSNHIPFEYAYSLTNSVSKDSIEQVELARYYITDAESKGIDVTAWSISDTVATIFYTKNNELCMANVSFKSGTQSWGKLHIVDTCMIQTHESKINILNFRWQFYNSYDSIRGVCKAVFSQKVTPLGTFSKLKLILTENDTIIYKGYRANSIDTLGLYNIFNENI